ncbi:MAG: Methionyl-tRNA formyltransferase [Alyxoria varia]|nr:MAG: Methionyl-tRNA formyltransferase [Alyxoria varia]
MAFKLSYEIDRTTKRCKHEDRRRGILQRSMRSSASQWPSVRPQPNLWLSRRAQQLTTLHHRTSHHPPPQPQQQRRTYVPEPVRLKESQQLSRVGITNVWKRQLKRRLSWTHDPLHVLLCARRDRFAIDICKALIKEHGMNKWMLGALQVLYKDADDTAPDKRIQSGQEDLLEKARRKNIPVHEWRGWDKFEIPKGVNMIITAGFEPAIPTEVLEKLKYTSLCIQPSLMPNNPVEHPIHEAVAEHRKMTGISILTLTPQVQPDLEPASRIIAQHRVELDFYKLRAPVNTLRDHHKKCRVHASRLIREVLRSKAWMSPHTDFRFPPEDKDFQVQPMKTSKHGMDPSFESNAVDITRMNRTRLLAVASAFDGKVVSEQIWRMVLPGGGPRAAPGGRRPFTRVKRSATLEWVIDMGNASKARHLNCLTTGVDGLTDIAARVYTDDTGNHVAIRTGKTTAQEFSKEKSFVNVKSVQIVKSAGDPKFETAGEAEAREEYVRWLNTKSPGKILHELVNGLEPRDTRSEHLVSAQGDIKEKMVFRGHGQDYFPDGDGEREDNRKRMPLRNRDEREEVMGSLNRPLRKPLKKSI